MGVLSKKTQNNQVNNLENDLRNNLEHDNLNLEIQDLPLSMPSLEQSTQDMMSTLEETPESPPLAPMNSNSNHMQCDVPHEDLPPVIMPETNQTKVIEQRSHKVAPSQHSPKRGMKRNFSAMNDVKP